MRRAGYLFPDEAPSVSVVNPHGRSPFLIACDHAANRLPRRLGDFGLPGKIMASHIAWDPGALPVAEALSGGLDATLVHGNYSRLVVDLNRPAASPGHMPAESAGIAIPANAALSQAERDARREALFFPYHDTIGRLIDARLGAGRPTMLLALHSFTPDYPGETRPWHVGVTHRADRGLGSLMVDLLRQRTDLCVGDNQPYRIDDIDDVTVPVHGERRDLPNVLIELRQDTLATAHGIAETAEWLSATLDRAAGMVLAWSRPDQRF